MLYSCCTHMATVGVKGVTTVSVSCADIYDDIFVTSEQESTFTYQRSDGFA